jgi:hypothetical protein
MSILTIKLKKSSKNYAMWVKNTANEIENYQNIR